MLIFQGVYSLDISNLLVEVRFVLFKQPDVATMRQSEHFVSCWLLVWRGSKFPLVPCGRGWSASQ